MSLGTVGCFLRPICDVYRCSWITALSVLHFIFIRYLAWARIHEIVKFAEFMSDLITELRSYPIFSVRRVGIAVGATPR